MTGTRPPGEGRARPVVSEGGKWAGYSTEEWIARIAAASTPVREYVDGRFVAWIDTTRPATRPAESDLARPSGAARRDAARQPGSPDVTPRSSGTPSRGVVTGTTG